jgi:subtilisin
MFQISIFNDEIKSYFKRSRLFLFLLSLLGLMFFLSIALPVYAADNNRYFIKNNSGVWKKYFGARNSFNNGFTADLSDFQLRLAKIFGLDFEPVTRVYILQNEIIQKSDQVSRAKENNSRIEPLNHIPWGVKMIYNDPFLEKTSGGSGVNVAVLDTGVFKNHPDLKNSIKDCKDFSNPKVSLIDGKCEDKNGHGTHVIGIIAANGGDDGLGIYGIAPLANIYAYKVCSANGLCWADDVALAIKTAVDNGANIINLSLGSDNQSPLIHNAIVYANQKKVLVVAAAGNDGPYLDSIDYPAANSEVIGVGALDVNQVVPDWSSRGSNSKTEAYLMNEGDIEFAAPGVSVESTWKDGGYAILSGTSMSAPHISGLAAKLWQGDAPDPAEATREILHKFSTDLFPLGDDDDSGWGLPTL